MPAHRFQRSTADAVMEELATTDADTPATIVTLRSIGDRAEIERWNRILTAPHPTFNAEPNAFLVAITTGLTLAARSTSASGKGATRSIWRSSSGT